MQERALDGRRTFWLFLHWLYHIQARQYKHVLDVYDYKNQQNPQFPKLHIKLLEQFEGSRTFTNLIKPLLPKNRTEQPCSHTHVASSERSFHCARLLTCKITIRTHSNTQTQTQASMYTHTNKHTNIDIHTKYTQAYSPGHEPGAQASMYTHAYMHT
jgi:hypothetical protein